MNGQTSQAGKATAAAASAPARPATTKADAAENKADKAKADKGGKADPEPARPVISGLADDSDIPQRDRSAAGAVEGKFVCRRELHGDEVYQSGDPREGKVSDLVHLVRSGALAPADAKTAEACNVYGNLDVKPISAKKAEG